MNLFGKKKEEPRVDPLKAINDLQANIETLGKRGAHLETKINIAKQQAIAKANTDKKGALQQIKFKKLYEAELEKIDNTKFQLETQILALQSASMNVQIFNSLNQGKEAMKTARGNLDAEKVEQIRDEMDEEKDLADQIAEAISRPTQNLCDDDELLAELDDLVAQEEPETFVHNNNIIEPTPSQSIFNIPQMPTVPTSSIRTPATSSNQIMSDEEKELQELAKLMS